MKRFFLIIALALATLPILPAFLPDTWTVKAEASSLLGSLLGEKSRFEKEQKVLTDEGIPLVAESRELATGFQPIPKRDATGFAVPTAHASIIMDADSGEVLYAQNGDEERQIASLTKMFTSLIVVEQVKDLNEPVTITEEAVYAPGTRVGCPRSGYCPGERLKPGEQVRVIDLLKAALMNSANDAAIALGIHLGGSEEGFAKIMNKRASELGLEHSHFCTPSGLEPDGREKDCYSSANDIAVITAQALKHPLLWDIMRIEETTITSVDGRYVHEIKNTDELLGQMPNLLGTKTGFTPLAGYSLMAVVTDHTAERRLIAVVLDDQYRWQSIRSMFDWSFQSFDWK